jgi:hypothetical protein
VVRKSRVALMQYMQAHPFIMEVQFKAGMKRREMAVWPPLTEMTDHHRLEEWQG